MRFLRHRNFGDEGWTFIEAILGVVIMAIMVLGLTIVLLAFREHLERSWAVRMMDQYGNDVVERLTHELRNAIDVSVRPDTRETDRFTIKTLEPILKQQTLTHLWYADLRSGQIKVDHHPLDPSYPPRRTRRGESFGILRFKLERYGLGQDIEADERVDWPLRNESFCNATYTIRLVLRHTRGAVNPGDRNWTFEKEYKNTVYMRNKNLIVKEGFFQ